MPGRNILVVLTEIEQAIEGIDKATAGKSIDDFANDWLLKHGVERGLEIISEACRHILDDLLSWRPKSDGSRYAASETSSGMNTTRFPSL